MNLYLHFEASEALYYSAEDTGGEDGLLHGSDQQDSLVLGPFPEFIQLTYQYVRVGPDGDHIAAFDPERGVWVIGIDMMHLGPINVLSGHDQDGMIFSDVVITERGPADKPVQS